MKRKLLLFGLMAALLITAGLVFARDYTTVKKLNITSDEAPFNGNIIGFNISSNGRYLFYLIDEGMDNSSAFVYDLELDTIDKVEKVSSGWISNDGRYIYSFTISANPNIDIDGILYDRLEKSWVTVGTGLNGEALNGWTEIASMSPDARYFTYYTGATNPFDGIAPICPDPVLTGCSGVFLWDRETNTQERISVNSQGDVADNANIYGDISDDGNIVAFSSNASNLTEAPLPCTPSSEDFCQFLYVRDRVAGTTELISIAPDGSIISDSDGYSIFPFYFHLSGNGRYVVFMSDSNPSPDVIDPNVYIRDILNNTTEMVNVDSDEIRIPNSRNTRGNGISNDGRFVMFVSGDGLLYVRDRLEGVTTIANRDADGNTGFISNDFSTGEGSASISASGDTIVFESESDTLIGATPSDTSEKIFVSQGEAIPPTSTPTDVPQTATVVPTDTTPTSTPQPSTTPSCDQPTELLVNGSFEVAANWQEKRLVRSKRVQNKPDKIVAHSGDFAFQFKGIGRIMQTVNSISGCGDVLTLSAWGEGRKLNAARVQAKVIYANGDPVKLRLSNEELNAGTYAYKPLSATLNLTGDVESIKVQISKRNSTGRLRIDDVSLSLGANATLITLPIAQ